MKKNKIYAFITAIAISSALCGCSMTGEPEPSQAPIKPDPIINVYGEYGLMTGFSQYIAPDNGCSIQLPEGSIVNDTDVNNITVTVASGFENKDLINISKSTGVRPLTTTSELMDLLKNDNSIDITGFFTLSKDGAYEGYKYTYAAMDNPALKGIVSVFFTSDGSAYTVHATIVNGNDNATVTTINSSLDSFINHL
jgi:hypothetical protein